MTSQNIDPSFWDILYNYFWKNSSIFNCWKTAAENPLTGLVKSYINSEENNKYFWPRCLLHGMRSVNTRAHSSISDLSFASWANDLIWAYPDLCPRWGHTVSFTFQQKDLVKGPPICIRRATVPSWPHLWRKGKPQRSPLRIEFQWLVHESQFGLLFVHCWVRVRATNLTPNNLDEWEREPAVTPHWTGSDQ
jgi:hypothetical protein